MKVYELNPDNFGKYKHKLNDILKKPNMCGVFSKSCGHCESMKPEWDKLKNKVAGTPGNGSLIEIDSNVIPEINYKPLTQKIQGFPTILIIKQGIPKMEYTGNRTFNDMFRYFNKNLSQHYPSSSDSHSIEKSPYSHDSHFSSHPSMHRNIPTIINNDEPSIKKTRKRKRKQKRKSRQTGGSTKNKKKSSKCVCCNKKSRCTRKCICGATCLSSCPCCNKKKRKHSR